MAASIWWHFDKKRSQLGTPMRVLYLSYQQLTLKKIFRLFVLLPDRRGMSDQSKRAHVFARWLDGTKCDRPECQTGLSLCFIYSAFHTNPPDITSHLPWQTTTGSFDKLRRLLTANIMTLGWTAAAEFILLTHANEDEKRQGTYHPPRTCVII